MNDILLTQDCISDIEVQFALWFVELVTVDSIKTMLKFQYEVLH